MVPARDHKGRLIFDVTKAEPLQLARKFHRKHLMAAMHSKDLMYLIIELCVRSMEPEVVKGLNVHEAPSRPKNTGYFSDSVNIGNVFQSLCRRGLSQLPSGSPVSSAPFFGS